MCIPLAASSRHGRNLALVDDYKRETSYMKAGMSDHHSHRTLESDSRASASRGSLLGTVVHLWPYIWPSDRDDLKFRVIGSLLLLLAAKLATVAVPFTFKWATDA